MRTCRSTDSSTGLRYTIPFVVQGGRDIEVLSRRVPGDAVRSVLVIFIFILIVTVAVVITVIAVVTDNQDGSSRDHSLAGKSRGEISTPAQ